MTHLPPDAHVRLRALPSVDRLAAQLATRSGPTPVEAVAGARAVLARRRDELRAGAEDDPDLVARGHAHLAPSLRRVLNGTGVVLHTNLGRAPLADAAIAAVHQAARGASNLELDLDTGRRGARDAHVRGLLRELSGAQDAFVVNNGAAATLLAVAALSGREGTIVVSRGELIEIGGGFRIPDVVAQAGAWLLEVGTTNRTRVADYRAALAAADRSTVILRVHQSNFRTVGFAGRPSIEELCALDAPLIDDVGSGALVHGLDALDDEPPVPRSVAAGATVVCFSGDKLLGGPQAGILVGTAAAIAACRRHPLARALRIGRLPLAGLEATLALHRDPARALREVPALAMLVADERLLEDRARRLAAATGGEIVRAVARVGGGALPGLQLPGPAVSLVDGEPASLAARLRRGDPPLIGRIAAGRVLIDPRTLADSEIDEAIAAVLAARDPGSRAWM